MTCPGDSGCGSFSAGGTVLVTFSSMLRAVESMTPTDGVQGKEEVKLQGRYIYGTYLATLAEDKDSNSPAIH